MSRLEKLRQEIQALSPEEFAELRDWLIELDNRLWDEQIEADERSGRLDVLAGEAAADLAAGNFMPFPPEDPPK